MLETLIFLAPPVSACILLALMLGYLGNHILTRGVIFVDIAVAQVAALGTMIGILFGAAEGSTLSSAIALAFTLAVVALFSLARNHHREVSQEVVIGIIYCMALAMAYVLVDRVPGGSNFVQKTFTGAILWVSWSDVIRLVVVFAIIGAIHYRYSGALTRLSTMREADNTRALDLLFYITFGIVVVESVKIGGIFVVFMMLIAPAATIQFFTDKWFSRIVFSWLVGILGTILGIWASYHAGLPNGPTIVCVLGVILILGAVFSRRVSECCNTPLTSD
jgi:zinc/manganese transport system permease protein